VSLQETGKTSHNPPRQANRHEIAPLPMSRTGPSRNEPSQQRTTDVSSVIHLSGAAAADSPEAQWNPGESERAM
jgi:hypothetical protein